MYANIFGDFVKGKNLSHFSPIVQKGITLHRSIDSFMDQHPINKHLLRGLHADLPKVSGLAIDLFYDHLLSKNWKDFSDIPLNLFIQNFENYSINQVDYPNESFHHVLMRMKKGQWLQNYASLDGLDEACKGVSQRITFPNVLFAAKDVFIAHEQQITTAFYEFMKEAISFFEPKNKDVND